MNKDNVISFERYKGLKRHAEAVEAEILSAEDTGLGDWAIYLGDGFYWNYYAGREPSRFFRWVSKTFIGIEWVEVSKISEHSRLQ